MTRYQRAAMVSSACIALLVLVLVEVTLALPVQGNLDITSGEVRILPDSVGDTFGGSVQGPGFALGFVACVSFNLGCIRVPERVPSPNLGRSIPPDTRFSPTVFIPDASPRFFFDFASATILGVNYRWSNAGDAGDLNWFLAASPFEFRADFLSPPLPPNSQGPFSSTLLAPFTFTGEVIITDNDLGGRGHPPLLDLHLSGQGTATTTLGGPDCVPRGSNECGWVLGPTTFDFSPTPEPTTCLLLGSSLAGLGLAAWRKLRHT
jgi:hypothetical protein